MNATVRFAEPMARHTAYRTGGPCDVWVVAHDVQALTRVIADCEEVGWPWTVVGAGTRTVFRDGAVEGVVIRLGTAFARIEAAADMWSVGAAVPVCALAARAARMGLGGLVGMAAVPGSVGASVLKDPWGSALRSIAVLRRNKVVEVDPSEVGRRPVVVGARIDPGPAAVAAKRASEETRRALMSAAGWYQDDMARLWMGSAAGTRLRQVLIPREAPDLMVNLGGGTARDFSQLQRSVLERLRRERGVTLAPALVFRGVGGDA